MLADEGMTMIVVTHEIPFAREVANRVAFFHEGKIHEIGSSKDLISNPKKIRTKEFLSKIL
jgi:polar amino acid transport system ATP-binding protein